MQLLTWICLNTDKKKDSDTSDFISAPEGLVYIVTKDDDGIDSGWHNYQRRRIVR